MSVLVMIWVFCLLAAIGGYTPAWGFVILGVIVAIPFVSTYFKMENKNPNDIDINKMNRDVGKKSTWEIRSNYANGKYDKDKK